MSGFNATCPKCQGSGVLTAYRHIHNGACFMCKGSGVIFSRAQATEAPPIRQRGKEVDLGLAWASNARIVRTGSNEFDLEFEFVSPDTDRPEGFVVRFDVLPSGQLLVYPMPNGLRLVAPDIAAALMRLYKGR